MVGILPGIGVAATGTFDESESVLERLRNSSDLIFPASVRPVAVRLHKLCERLRWEQIEAQITRPWLRMSYRKFCEHCVSANMTPPVSEAFKAIQAFKPSLALLVAGIDTDRAHLYTVTHENVVSHASTGFIIIGSGTFTGTDHLITRRKLFKTRSLAETIFAMYETKRAAECVTGVGRATDIAIIRQGMKTEFLTAEQIESLGLIYDRMGPPALSAEDSETIDGFLNQQSLPAPIVSESATADPPAPPPSPESA